MDHAAVKVLQVHLRLFEIHNESDKAGMARKECGEKILEEMRRPDLVRLGFIVNGQDALAGSCGLQETPDPFGHAHREAWRGREITETQRGIQTRRDGEGQIRRMLSEGSRKSYVKRGRKSY